MSPAAPGLGNQHAPAVLPHNQAGHSSLLIGADPPDIFAMEKMTLRQLKCLPPLVMSAVHCIHPK